MGLLSLLEPTSCQILLHACNGPVIEAPFALLDEQVEVLAGDAIIVSEMALGLVPEVLDAVDVIPLIGEQPGVVDPHVVEL